MSVVIDIDGANEAINSGATEFAQDWQFQIQKLDKCRGSFEFSLYRNGTELAKASIKTKDLVGQSAVLTQFTVGTEGDNGTTDSLISYVLDNTALQAGEYYLKYELGGTYRYKALLSNGDIEHVGQGHHDVTVPIVPAGA